jgi:hypothetical protein
MLMPADGTLRRNERYRGNRAGLKKTATVRERGRILPELRLGDICADRIKPRDLSGSGRNQRLRAIILRSGGVGLSVGGRAVSRWPGPWAQIEKPIERGDAARMRGKAE